MHGKFWNDANFPLFATSALLVGLLATFTALLHQDWEVYPQYSYGWLVPLICGYLFHRRWLDRPTAARWRPAAWAWLPASALFLFLWPVIWVFREANPDWRLVSWVAGLFCVGCLLLTLTLRGGLPWAWHFSFPVTLLLIAIPWPSGWENFLIQGMTRAVTAVTVEGLTWAGIYAEQRGNVILLARGSLGVDEACSGVRSFQSNLLAALVVGELYRLTLPRRLILLACGLALGFGLNLGRSLFLSWQAYQGGTDNVALWHDPAGYTILILSFGLLLALALVLRTRSEARPATPEQPPTPVSHHPAQGWLLVGAALWLGSAPLLKEVWYRAHEDRSATVPRATLTWPDGQTPTALPIPDKVRTILRYGSARAFHWTEPGGSPWFLYEIDWPASRTGAQLARSHSPDICLPAAGAEMLDQGNTRPLSIHGLPLSLTPYTFRLGRQTAFVFFVLWEQATVQDPAGLRADYYSHAQRMEAVKQGRRSRGQKVIHATLAGYPDRAAAEAAFLSFLENHLSREHSPLPNPP